MAEVIKTFKYSKTGKFGSLILLAVIIWITASFAIYDFFLKKDIVKINAQIVEHLESIKKLEWEKKVHVYSLIKKHQKILTQLDERSHITKYMDHLTAMSKHYDFEARGFQFSWSNLKSKVTFENNELGLAYKKSVRFISDYRWDETSLLDLEFIWWVTATDTNIKFPVDFTLKK